MTLQPVFDLANAEVIHAVPSNEFTLAGLPPDLHEFVDWDGPLGPMFDHPLHREINMRMTAALPERRYDDVVIPAGLASIGFVIDEKTKERDGAAFCGDWRSYVFVHHRPYRVEALLHVIRRVGASRIWPLVGDVWTDSESNMASADEWADIWSHAYDHKQGGFRKCFKRVMGAADRRAYEALPEVVTCYRGCRAEHHVYGYSWTLDREKAVWFARRHSRSGSGIVAKVEVHKSVVLAYFGSRKEAEVVLDIDYLDEVAELQHLEAPALANAA